jgi:hypothetical protein
MFEAEHDSYAENAPGCFYWAVWVAWVAANVVAFLLGESLREAVISLINPQVADLPRALSLEGRVAVTGSPEILSEVLGAVASGAVIAVGQSLVLFPFLKLAGALEWAAATIIGRAAGWIAIYAVSRGMLGIVVDEGISGLCLLFVLLVGVGIIAGIALGYAQGIVFRRRVDHPSWWVLANIPGFAATGVLVLLTLDIQVENVVRDYTTLIIAATTAMITGIALMELLRHPSPQAEWRKMFKPRVEKVRIPPPVTVLGSTLYEPRKPAVDEGPGVRSQESSPPDS